MGERARALARAMAEHFQIHIHYRHPHKTRAISEFARGLERDRANVVYVLDLAYSGVAAALAHRARRGTPWVLDTGDAIHALAKSMGTRGRAGVLLTGALEQVALRTASAIVVRGTFHQELLARWGIASTVIQDGVDCTQFAPLEAGAQRARMAGPEELLVGVLGSCVWNPRLGVCYGWELVEALRLMPDAPVHGVLIGDGDGVGVLRERCRRYRLEDRMHFLGRLSYSELPQWMSAIDVFLSTQTDDVVGQVRTTGKLPLYLASGRHVLASRVGEAARVLPARMLLRHDGQVDPSYPFRLAERLRSLLERPRPFAPEGDLMRLARERFDYQVLGQRLARLLLATAR